MTNLYMYILSGIIMYCVLLTLWIWYIHGMVIETARVVNENAARVEEFMRQHSA